MPTPSWTFACEWCLEKKFPNKKSSPKLVGFIWWLKFTMLEIPKNSPKGYKSKLRRSNSSTTKAHWTSCPGPGWERCPTWQCQASCVSTRIGGSESHGKVYEAAAGAEKKNLETPQARSRKSTFHWRNDLLNYDFRVSCWKWCLRIVSKLVYKFYNLFMGPIPSLYKGHNPLILSIRRTSQAQKPNLNLNGRKFRIPDWWLQKYTTNLTIPETNSKSP